MKIFQSKLLEQRVKKLPKPEKAALDQEVRKIAADPLLGEAKKGDLKGIFIHKFKLQSTPYLLAYRMHGEDLELIMLGPHENYYRDLKRYLNK
jgi:mRNA interferase RelE/StbE